MASANTTTALIVLLGLAVADCFVPAHTTSLQATRQTCKSERLSRHIPIQCAMEPPVVRRDALGQWTHALAIGTLLQVGALSAVAEDSSPPLGSSRRPVVVLGAGGKLGKEVVLSLLRKGGYGVRACSRGQLETSDLGSADFPADDVDVMTGIDVTKPETLQEALAGAGAVIVCSSASAKGGKADAVDCIGVENVAKACLSARVERLILVSSLGVTRQNSLAYKMTNTLGNIMDWKEQGEERVRAAYKGQDKLSYTIIRPGGLERQAVGLDKVMLVQGDTAYSSIGRPDVAEVCVASIFRSEARFATFEVLQREAKPLEVGLSVEGVSGKHTTDAPYDVNDLAVSRQNSAALGPLFEGLKSDGQFDATNGYKPLKPADSS